MNALSILMSLKDYLSEENFTYIESKFNEAIRDHKYVDDAALGIALIDFKYAMSKGELK